MLLGKALQLNASRLSPKSRLLSNRLIINDNLLGNRLAQQKGHRLFRVCP